MTSPSRPSADPREASDGPMEALRVISTLAVYEVDESRQDLMNLVDGCREVAAVAYRAALRSQPNPPDVGSAAMPGREDFEPKHTNDPPGTWTDDRVWESVPAPQPEPAGDGIVEALRRTSHPIDREQRQAAADLIDELRARVERLEEALRPFAEYGSHLAFAFIYMHDKAGAVHMLKLSGDPGENIPCAIVRSGDFRRAASALDTGGGHGG